MKNSFSILEYKSIYYNKENTYKLDSQKNLAVPKKVFDDLKQFVLKNNEQTLFLKPSYKNGLGETLQANNYVGVIQTKDGTTIEILPKIREVSEIESKEILIKMLKTLAYADHIRTASRLTSGHSAEVDSYTLPIYIRTI